MEVIADYAAKRPTFAPLRRAEHYFGGSGMISHQPERVLLIQYSSSNCNEYATLADKDKVPYVKAFAVQR
jgi:hypothetical protein